ncbi:MAG: hypothetical protein AAGA71_19070 [Pseudomonadota bacterium]
MKKIILSLLTASTLSACATAPAQQGTGFTMQDAAPIVGGIAMLVAAKEIKDAAETPTQVVVTNPGTKPTPMPQPVPWPKPGPKPIVKPGPKPAPLPTPITGPLPIIKPPAIPGIPGIPGLPIKFPFGN